MPGVYEYKLITSGEASDWLNNSQWTSTVGYEETAKALEIITGFKIPVNKIQIKMQLRDEALVYRLTKRLSDQEIKGKQGVETVIANSEMGILRRLK